MTPPTLNDVFGEEGLLAARFYYLIFCSSSSIA